MRILITNSSLGAVGGVQAYVRDLACWLLEQGHSPIVYAPLLGVTARQLQQRTVPVTDDLSSIGVEPDVIHGNSAWETIMALLHFPDAPASFVCHGWGGKGAMAPHFPRILRYVAVDDTCADRLISCAGIPMERLQTVLNAVDVRRFKQRDALPARPRRALVFSNLAHEMTHLRPIRRACAEARIELDVIGRVAGCAVERPEELLGHYDLIFAKAKCAIEAMAVGAAVILCDANGFGGLVRYAEVPRLRRLNFGIRVLRRPISAETIRSEIDAYDAADARRVSDLIRRTAGNEDAHRETLGILEAIFNEFNALPQPPDRLIEGRAVAEFLRRMVAAERAQRQDVSLLMQAAQKLMALPVLGNAVLALARLLSGVRTR